ncbi:sugar O-acetyltransferase [Pseudohalocynthiibacter aestuariivivens]|uniref:Sugar O-acetyltransferase n=1 Tax=Roseovarius pelagicus TaxID=2980108 RepID=A0ABY6DHV3_9RHOB|nr:MULTISPECIES: sugar O-acetyltransferase [Rhodobacterales]QIE44699.1 sugar O-acetyltransferase [Pseudohalocynthiibacter aestuariivivens]UXX83390.1 sugar O-acetyltransferase [Roseovarius pelagicus]
MAPLTERDKMQAGDWYRCLDPDLLAMQARARDACHQHSTTAPDTRGPIGATLRALMAQVGEGTFVEAPFHCAYGINIHLGRDVYLNAGCTILDTAPVHIGDRCMLGPQVQIYCPEHHHDPVQRRAGLERAHPVTLGADVWIGGGATLLGGVTIGAGAIVGAGSVVTRDVPQGATVMGNPARQRG